MEIVFNFVCNQFLLLHQNLFPSFVLKILSLSQFFSFSNNSLTINTNDLFNLKTQIGLVAMDEPRLLFFIWKYCLANEKINYNQNLANIICDNWKWTKEITDLAVFTSSSQDVPKSQEKIENNNNDDETEEDVDII